MITIRYTMFNVHWAQTSRAFVWFLDIYGGSLGSYLPIALQNKIFKYHDLGIGSF